MRALSPQESAHELVMNHLRDWILERVIPSDSEFLLPSIEEIEEEVGGIIREMPQANIIWWMLRASRQLNEQKFFSEAAILSRSVTGISGLQNGLGRNISLETFITAIATAIHSGKLSASQQYSAFVKKAAHAAVSSKIETPAPSPL